MAKQIVFTYEDKEYTLEFTRRTVKQISASVKRLSRKCAMLNLWANLSTWQ